MPERVETIIPESPGKDLKFIIQIFKVLLVLIALNLFKDIKVLLEESGGTGSDESKINSVEVF